MTALTKHFLRFQKLVNEVSYKRDTGFDLVAKGDVLLLRHWQLLPDCNAELGIHLTKQHGRKFYISSHMTDGEFVQTCLMAALAFEEHEAREEFKFHGARLFSPHKSIDALMCVQEEKRDDSPLTQQKAS